MKCVSFLARSFHMYFISSLGFFIIISFPFSSISFLPSQDFHCLPSSVSYLFHSYPATNFIACPGIFHFYFIPTQLLILLPAQEYFISISFPPQANIIIISLLPQANFITISLLPQADFIPIYNYYSRSIQWIYGQWSHDQLPKMDKKQKLQP